MNLVHEKKMEKLYQKHMDLYEEIETMYEDNVKFIMRLRWVYTNYLIENHEEMKRLDEYEELRETGIACEMQIEQMEKDHAFQMFQLEEMKQTLRNTCVDSIMTEPMTHVAKKIQATQQEVARATASQTGTAWTKAQEVARAMAQQLPRATASQAAQTKAQKRNLRRTRARAQTRV